MRKFLCLTALTSLLSTSAFAETVAQGVDYSSIPAPLIKIFMNGNGQYKEGFFFSVLQPLRHQGRSKSSIDQQDIDFLIQQNQNDESRRQIQQYLRYDLNFDGIVTEEEIKESLDGQVKTSSEFNSSRDALQLEHMKMTTIKKLQELDADGDGRISIQEMSIVKKPERANLGRSSINDLKELLLLDPDKDGVLTVAELTMIAEKSFKLVDLNNDGQLSHEELSPLRQRLEQDRRSARDIGPKCVGLPKVDAEDKIIYMSAHEGKTSSSVSVAGQMEDTDVVPVVIEAGEGKLYIIASAFSPVVWQFSGATDRVTKVIAAGSSYNGSEAEGVSGAAKVKAGVIGIDKAKVSFVDNRACGLLGGKESPARNVSRGDVAVERLLGRKPDMSLDQYSILTARIGGEIVFYGASSGVPSAPDGFDKDAWTKHVGNMPGGVAMLQKESIISDVPTEDYNVLPKWAGISQLVGSGALQPISGGFKIAKPIPYYPSGLHGGYSTYFLLGNGIPAPKGNAGHSCVKSEETGKPITSGVGCRGEFNAGVSIDTGEGRDLIIINRP